VQDIDKGTEEEVEQSKRFSTGRRKLFEHAISWELGGKRGDCHDYVSVTIKKEWVRKLAFL